MSDVARDFDVQVESGRIRARRHGPEKAPVVLALPGLTANLACFDYLAERLAGDAHQLVALDLRGRGRSDAGPPGSYGWPAHARDALAVADRLGVERFAVIGWSMGGAVAMAMVAQQPSRLTRVALIDILTTEAPDWAPVIRASVDRLGTVFPSRRAYMDAVKALGTIAPWSEYWERYFEYELEDVEGGVRARTRREAALEDFDYGFEHDCAQWWPDLSLPTLLLRATQPLLPGTSYLLVTEAQRDRFRKAVPHAHVVEVDANHYGIATKAETAEALEGFLRPVATAAPRQ
jgi:pimeloyl-ACP methyl ester carboxylesterase